MGFKFFCMNVCAYTHL